MIKQQQILLSVIATLLFATGGKAVASDNTAYAFDREVKSCIAEINDRANYEGAKRVRHTVVPLKNTFIGRVLTIETTVFSDSDESALRAYTSYCVAKGAEKPVKFKITEKSA